MLAEQAVAGKQVGLAGQERRQFGTGLGDRQGGKGSQREQGGTKPCGVRLAGLEQHFVHGLDQCARI
ncbi:MAG TPA: hypothetical protein DCL83_05750 [Arthrobacter bacterium]|nr:hypothetical protein [Arthrobacter sp.]